VDDDEVQGQRKSSSIANDTVYGLHTRRQNSTDWGQTGRKSRSCLRTQGYGFEPMTATGPGNQLEGFHRRLWGLIDLARLLPDITDEAVSEVYGPSVDGTDFPLVTAARQMVSLVPLYKAALVALKDPQSSLGTQALMRSLLEAWAHLYFIMGTDELRGAPCRALQVELGWAQNARGTLLEVGSVPDGLLAEVEARIEVLGELQKAHGCTKCGAHDYSSVQATLVKLSKVGPDGIPWLIGEWRSTSQVSHVAGWEWLAADGDDGSTTASDPRPSTRAIWLNHLVLLFHNVAQTYFAVALVPPSGRGPMSNASRLLLDDPWLKRMIDGEFD
jgi:hypothetical protein